MDSHLIDSFLRHQRLELNHSPHTVAAYRNDLRQFAAWADAQQRPQRFDVVDTKDIRQWLVDRSDAGDGPRTLRRKVQSLRAFYAFLLRQGIVEDNPAADVELAKLPKRLPEYVRPADMDTILDNSITPASQPDADDADTLRNVRDDLIVLLLYSTGLRRAELIGLRDAAVDTRAGLLRVLGKRGKERIVPFGPELADAIDHYRQLRHRAGLDGDTLLTRSGGQPLYPSLVYQAVHLRLRGGGVAGKASPHVLRHSFATAMLGGGARLDSVKQLLGHASLATTQIYTHVTLSEIKHNYELAHPRAQKSNHYGT